MERASAMVALGLIDFDMVMSSALVVRGKGRRAAWLVLCKMATDWRG